CRPEPVAQGDTAEGHVEGADDVEQAIQVGPIDERFGRALALDRQRGGDVEIATGIAVLSRARNRQRIDTGLQLDRVRLRRGVGLPDRLAQGHLRVAGIDDVGEGVHDDRGGWRQPILQVFQLWAIASPPLADVQHVPLLFRGAYFSNAPISTIAVPLWLPSLGRETPRWSKEVSTPRGSPASMAALPASKA